MLQDCKTTSHLSDDSEALLSLSINGQSYSETGHGNGAFDAFVHALDKILKANTQLQRPKLIDYQVHIPKGGKTNALTEAAITWELANGRKMTTRGVNSNQVFAAMQATIKALNTILN